MKATIKDVALRAGVGVGTVSRVINHQPSVKESTRKKVEQAIKELNYEPDEYARGLKMNRTNTIALILPSVWHPFFSEFAYFVEREASRLNLKVLLCNSNGESDKELEYIQMVKQNKVDGIIGITYSDIDQYISAGLPFVSIDRYFTEDVIYVTADNAASGKMAAKELIARGCQHLAYIGGYQETPNETKNRRKHFEVEVRSSGFSCEVLDMLEPLYDVEDRVRHFLLEHPQIDGIFTINDLMALDVMKVLTSLNLRVPEDIQVIGCDGLTLAESRDVLVSTIKQPIKEMAETSVRLLRDVVNSEIVSGRTVLPVSFAEGGTTKKIKNSVDI